jgi:peptidoglycan/xylan/chitin deacetylase (PgdA/CDA1 family)
MTQGVVFRWPASKKAAISLTFDDARPSQVDAGLPILDRFGVKATFYLSPQTIEIRQDAWRKGAAHGHEMGNHTLTHPCSANFVWSHGNALEDKTLDDLSVEMDKAGEVIRDLVGVIPRTFAYPCGQKYVGRGEALHSYVPIVAKQFLCGRGFRDESINSPLLCDLAQTMGVDSDDHTFASLSKWIERAVTEEGWLVLCSHDIGVFPRQAMATEVLEELCQYCSDPDKMIWIDTVAIVAGYILQQR